MTALEHREPDRVPLLCPSREFSIHYAGLKFADIWSDGGKYVDAQLKVVKDFRLDAAWDILATPAVDEAMGGVMDLPEDDAPRFPQPFLVHKRDLKKLRTDLDPTRDGRMPFLLSVVRSLKEKMAPDIPVIAWASPPFRTACMLRGMENLYRDMVKSPNFAHDLLETVVGPCTAYAKALVDAGADIIFTSNPVANRDCIRRDHYKAFSYPFTKRMVSQVKAYGDVKLLYHTCGNWDDRFDLVVDTGADILHVDKADLAHLKKRWGSRVTIMGNVRSVDILLLGKPDQVEAASVACIRKAAKGGGYILSGDCVLPRDVPVKNLEAMVKVALSEGLYA
jgi:uroporphyrinogen decarboxylase